jgi:hypothetical protein
MKTLKKVPANWAVRAAFLLLWVGIAALMWSAWPAQPTAEPSSARLADQRAYNRCIEARASTCPEYAFPHLNDR